MWLAKKAMPRATAATPSTLENQPTSPVSCDSSVSRPRSPQPEALCFAAALAVLAAQAVCLEPGARSLQRPSGSQIPQGVLV